MHSKSRMTKTRLFGLFVCLLIVASAFASCSSSPTGEPQLPTAEPPRPSSQPTSTAVEPPPHASEPASTAVEPGFPLDSPLAQSPLATPDSEVAAIPLEVPPDVPVPEAGKAAISGVLYSIAGQSPIPGTLFYLTPGRGESQQDPPTVLAGPREENGDIRGTSDAKGWVSLSNVPSGNYYLVMWAPLDWLIALESEDDQTPRLIALEPDEQLNLELIHMTWP
jgi:hypothetical protein